ncbi:lanthionine synthetase LanC family protein [Streptomyces sp. ISL-11]|uniref:lanthionine synthetase LanC family protein n=1 Tax=Streptomyces sp. ISL-11 TaxID=2819174 RepID=UPI001BE517EA|nr:lanthionine synthetase LanC family protein [Streptomyces sp. ISL-11]MBT2385877.1 hypothetical protein [Streptomyces sp. ISL-11]
MPRIAGGGAGLALAYHQLDRCLPGRGWNTLAEGCLAAAAEGYRRIGASPGLFGGAAGLAFAAQVPRTTCRPSATASSAKRSGGPGSSATILPNVPSTSSPG